MHNREALEMMERCKAEITALRERVGRLQPKAEAYDAIVQILRLLPQPSMGAGEDVLWVLNRRAREIGEELAREEEARKAATAPPPHKPGGMTRLDGEPR